MGRYLFEFIIPGVAVLAATYWGVKTWWLRRAGRVVTDVKTLRKKSSQYEEALRSTEDE